MAIKTPATPLRRWLLAPQLSPSVSDSLIAYPPVIRQLLAGRGVTTGAEADPYLVPDGRFLGSPDLLPDIEPAVGRILRALLSGERIAVYGDFDADGVTTTTLLVEALQSLGGDPISYIPHRVDEGHGINAEALAYLAGQGATLVITGDCGITGLPDGDAYPPGLDIIVTDHHLPGDSLPPVVAAVDPMRRDSLYPSPELAGVGVAFKLVQALYAALGRAWDEDLLELVALGTVADVAPLVGENRYLVRVGLERLRATKRPGIRALARQAGQDIAHLDEEAIAFGLAPRLNAAGRLAHADVSLRLLLTRDDSAATALAAELDALNVQRQQLTVRIVDRAREIVFEEDGGNAPLIMVGDPGFMPGIVGLAASRLAEEFYRPALVFQYSEDGQIRGSARSIPEFDVTDALAQCAPLLTRFGGHHQAAGFAAPVENMEPLKDRLIAFAGEKLDIATLSPTLHIDAETAPSALTGSVMGILQTMAPFGAGNPVPTFVARGMEVVSSRSVGADGAHLRLKLRESEKQIAWDAISFRTGDRASEARGLLDVAYRLRVSNGYGRSAGQRVLELEVLDFRPAGVES